MRRAPSNLTRGDYAEVVLAGGFPLPLQRPVGPSRSRWYRDYVDLVLRREILGLRQVRNPERLPDLFRHLAAQTAQPLNMSAAARRAGLTEDLAEQYTRLLEAVFLIHRLPAWGATLGSRMARHPKLHMVDTGLAGWLMGLSETKLVAKTPAALTEFGHLLETFATNEILKQASWSDGVLTSGHFRTHDGVEVDLIVERDDGGVAGVEVKAGSRVVGDDLRGLRHLRERLGSRFVGGVALHAGANSYTAEERIHVLPVDVLWR